MDHIEQIKCTVEVIHEVIEQDDTASYTKMLHGAFLSIQRHCIKFSVRNLLILLRTRNKYTWTKNWILLLQNSSGNFRIKIRHPICRNGAEKHKTHLDFKIIYRFLYRIVNFLE